MTIPLPEPSSRLLRAAAAECSELTRHRERLVQERDKVVDELRRLDEMLAAVDERLLIVGQLIGASPSPPPPAQASPPPPAQASPPPPAQASPPPPARSPQPPAAAHHRPLLRGPAIRETAVRVLIAQPQQIEALHYRRWYELLCEAGHAVAGKDPLAVFLTQVSRSPVVRKGTEPGVYEVDRQAPLRIRQRLERLQAELREVSVAPRAAVDLAAVRARRHELDLAISQHERALEEALQVLRRDDPQVPRIATRAG